MAAEGLPVERACLLLGVSVSGYYSWGRRPPSARSTRWAQLTDVTEHPTSEGKVLCAVVLDAFSRRVVGWPRRFPAHGRASCERAGDGDQRAEPDCG